LERHCVSAKNYRMFRARAFASREKVGEAWVQVDVGLFNLWKLTCQYPD
jgi:hypothetical protein